MGENSKLYFDEFRPSQKILDDICSDSNLLVQYIHIPTELSPENKDLLMRGLYSATVHYIAEVYKWGVDVLNNMKTENIQIVAHALENAIFHGSKNLDPVVFGLFLGDKGVCYGFKDSGDYFRSEEIKRLFESKSRLKEFGRSEEHWAGGRVGVSVIYDATDIIEVDIVKGILYCVQLKDSLDRKLSAT